MKKFCTLVIVVMLFVSQALAHGHHEAQWCREEADDYPAASGFRPVYSLECLCPSGEYDVDIDAITGKILKFKLDD